MASAISRPRPFLMIPLQRCGSHALRLRLMQSPEYYSPHPLNVVDFVPLVGLYGDLSRDESYFQLVLDMIGFQNLNLVKWPGVVLDPVNVFEACADRPRSVHAVFWEMMMQAAEQHGAPVVMDKSCESVLFAEDYLELLPDLHFVNVVRDPRAQINSINRAIIHNFDSLLNAQLWARMHDLADSLAQKHPDRVLTIRYEDFINNTESVLREICAFLGIQYVDAMRDLGEAKEAGHIASRSALWATNDKPPIKANIDKFTRELGVHEIEQIETVTGAHMKRHGYELMTEANADTGPEALEQARRRSEAAKERAWQDLQQRDPKDFQLRKMRAWYLGALRTRLEAARTTPLPVPAK